jgi:hypothetical protein
MNKKMVEIQNVELMEQDGQSYLLDNNSLNIICKENELIDNIVVDKEMTTVFDYSKFNAEKVKAKNYKINVLREWTFKEDIIIRHIELIVDNIHILQDKIGLGWDRKTNQRLDWQGTQTVLFNYCKQIRKGGRVEYKPTKNSKKGRHFSKTTSLQGISRSVRHTLCRDLYLDIDMTNCHPVIFVSLCKTYNFDCSDVLYYIENREKCLASLMEWTCRDRDWCKQTVLSLLNGGDCPEIFHYWGVVIPDSCKWISDFHKQVGAIHQNFNDHSAFTDHKKQLIKEVGLNEFNFNGKLVNRVLCEYENILIQHAMNFCSQRGIEIGANCFDGLMLRLCGKLNDEFIKEMEKYVVEEVGIPVKFVVKEMDEGFSLDGLKTDKEQKEYEKRERVLAKEQEKYNKTQEKLIAESELHRFQDRLSDKGLAKVFVDNTGDIVFKDTVQNCVYFYNEHNCLYERLESLDHLKKYFQLYLSDYCESVEPQNDIEQKFKKKRMSELLNAKGLSNLLSVVKIYLPDKTEFIMNNFNRKNIFPFDDNVIDFSLPKSEFIRERTKDDYCTFTTNNIYNPNYDKQWLIKYAGELLMTDDIEYINCFYTMLAHGLTNDNSIKLITFWIGDGDNGKSAMMTLYKSVLGDFCCSDASKAILEKRGSCLDTEKFILCNKRVATISELQKTDKLDYTFVKSYTGNDKNFMLRPRADSVQINVIIDPKTFIPTNEMPHIPDKQHAFLERICAFNFCNTFPRSAEKWNEIMSKQNDLFSFLCEKASELTANNFVFSPCHQMKTFTKSIKLSFDSIASFMDERVELTNDPEDYITARDLYTDYTNYCREKEREPVIIDVFGKSLRKNPYNYNCKERKRAKKINGKTYDCYFFIKKKVLEEEIDDDSNSINVDPYTRFLSNGIRIE